VIIGINAPKGPAAVDKAKAKPRAGGVSGANFADYLEAAQAGDEAAPVAVAGGVGVGGFIPVEEDLPRDAQGQARELLKTLRALAEDALAGSPTAAVGRLEKLAGEMDSSGMNEAQRAALDEVRTRAAVEVEKLREPER
jgi:enamine deaminase RidA (YjgF/YER057c/UK114 family)